MDVVLLHLLHAILRAGNGGQSGHLDHVRGAGSALALQLGHGVDDRRGRQRIAQPPAGHGVRLGERAHNHQVLLYVSDRSGGEPPRREIQVDVALVGDDIDAALVRQPQDGR